MTDTQHSLEQLPADVYAPLVEFSWGSGPTIARYCRWTDDIAIGATGEVYTAEPSLRYVMERAQHGGTEDAPVLIEMRMDKPPFDTLSLLYDHAPVRCTVWECSPLSLDAKLPVFAGKIIRMNVKSKRGLLASAKVSSVKRLLKVKAGLQALSTCPWIYRKSPCQSTRPDITGTVTNLQVNDKPNRIKIQISSPPDMDNSIWNRGYVEFDGLRIAIRRSYDDAGTDGIFRFDLRSFPPPDWLGEEVTIAPGCDGRIETCRIHDQEENFGGIGYAMLNRNPTIFSG